MIQSAIGLANGALNALSAHIAVLDGTGVIVFVNLAWRRFARNNGGAYAESSYVGANYLDVCRSAIARGDTDAQLALSGIEQVLHGRSEEFVHEYSCPGPDEDRWFRMSATRFASGFETCLVVAHEDITARRIAEAERERLLTEHERLRREAEAANQMKDDFIATLSHELRTPLQSVLGWTRILKRSVADPAIVAQATTAIDRNARLAVRLVDETLDLSRIERGNIVFEEADVDFVELVRQVLDTIRPAATEKGVAVTEQSALPDATVHGDATRLQQIVWNLLINALKFTPAGGCVEVRAHGPEPGWVELSVRDNGIGIAPEFLPHVFDRFRQGAGSSGQPGLGLGLSIAKELAVRHRGSITAASAGEGEGATFTLRLPLAAGV